VDFGDYLRALITADADLVPDDRLGYRLAIIESFRARGIYPRDVRNLSEESLLWRSPSAKEQEAFRKLFSSTSKLRRLAPDWGLTTDRSRIFEQARRSQGWLHKWFAEDDTGAAAGAAQAVLDAEAPEAFYRNADGAPALEVHSVRPTRRVGPSGHGVTELVVEMTQRRRGYYDPDVQRQADSGQIDPPEPDFIFRGGCTLLVDPDTATVRYCIYKRIRSESRLERMRAYLTGEDEPSLRAAYFDEPRREYFRSLASADAAGQDAAAEPFALLHRSFNPREVL